MRISVVITCYNKEAFILDAIRSALNQSYAAHEIIVIDDGSTDNSLNQIQLFSNHVQIYRQANSGPGRARNTGIDYASGDWIAFLDGDDIWLHGHLEELYQLHRNFPNAFFLGTSSDQVYKDFTNYNVKVPAQGDIKQSLQNYLHYPSQGVGVNMSSVCFHSTLLKNINGFRNYATGEDTDLYVRVSSFTDLAKSDKITSVYRRNDQSITGKIFSGGVQSNFTTIKSLKNISEAVSMSAKLLNVDNSLISKKLLKKHINSAISHAVRQRLINGQIDALGNARHLYVSSIWRSAELWRCLLYLPSGILNKIFFVRRLIKDAKNWVR